MVRTLLALGLLVTTLLSPAAAEARRPPTWHPTSYRQPWLFVGDSLTAGWRVTRHEAFPGVFDRALPAVWTVNAGRNGSCLVATGCYAWRPWVDDFERVAFPAHARSRPARIVVLLGTNDLCRPGVTVDQIEAGFLRLAELATTQGTPVTFLTLLPQAPPHAYCEDDRLAIDEWLLGASGLDVVDVATPLADEAGRLRPEYDADDGLHLSPAGQAAVARTLLRWVRAQGLQRPRVGS